MIGLDKTVEGPESQKHEFRNEHVLDARQFDRPTLEELFRMVPVMKRHALAGDDILRDCPRLSTLLFEQPSTRTYCSFWSALFYLGAKIIFPNQDAAHTSSFAKDESLEHTIEYFCRFPRLKVVIMRHSQDFAAFDAAKIADSYGVHIVNAADGTHQHPTQSLPDCYTMWEDRGGTLDGVKLAVCNDLARSRAASSLCLMVAKNFRVPEIVTCAPAGIEMGAELRTKIESYGTKLTPVDNLLEAAKWADYLYMTRPQFGSGVEIPDEVFKDFQVDADLIDQLPEDAPCKVLHPMPVSQKFQEISKSIDHHWRCIFFDQAEYAIYLRMGLVKNLLT